MSSSLLAMPLDFIFLGAVAFFAGMVDAVVGGGGLIQIPVLLGHYPQVAIPTLNKDFIIDEKQIIRARNAGASVILLIVAALPEERLKELYDYATELGLEVLVETHNREELEIAHRIGARIIGVNNRNLTTFEVDLQTSLDLAEYFQQGPVYISESAIFSGQDAQAVAPHFQGILVGTALMQAENVAEKIKELQIDKG